MRGPARSSDLIFLAGAAGMMTLILILTVMTGEAPAARFPEGSSYAATPAGTKAAYALLEEAGYDLRRSVDPIASIRETAAQSIVVLVDPLLPPSARDSAALERFVDAGGTVLAIGPSALAFAPGLTLNPAADRESQDLRIYEASIPSPLARNAARIAMRPAGSIRITDPAWVRVYGTSDDDPAVLTKSGPRGRLIWWASSNPISNAGIAAPGHLDLLLNVVATPGTRTILWDEYYHGQSQSLWTYVAGTPAVWALVQLSAIAALGIFTYCRRLGPMRALVVEPRTSPLEFIDSMGALYERARTADAAVAASLARARRVLRQRVGAGASTSDRELARAANARLPGDRADIEPLLTRAANAAGRSKLPEAEALAIVKELQTLSGQILSTNTAGTQRAEPRSR